VRFLVERDTSHRKASIREPRRCNLAKCGRLLLARALLLNSVVGIGRKFNERVISFCEPIDREVMAGCLYTIPDGTSDELASSTEALELVAETVIGDSLKPDFPLEGFLFCHRKKIRGCLIPILANELDALSLLSVLKRSGLRGFPVG
jgi:hypothetical protein